jgi:hypothetical protein
MSRLDSAKVFLSRYLNKCLPTSRCSFRPNVTVDVPVAVYQRLVRRDRQSDADEGLDCRRLCLLLPLLRLLALASLRARFSFRRFFSFRSFRLRLRSFSCEEEQQHWCCPMCSCSENAARMGQRPATFADC